MEDDRRTRHVDPRTVTGAYAVVKAAWTPQGTPKYYGNRPGDKPTWWTIGYHVTKAVIQILTALAIFGIAAWAKSCGVVTNLGLP